MPVRSILAGAAFVILSAGAAEAHDRFSFNLGLGFWSPAPIYAGPGCCHDYYPPPVVYRRVYVEPRPVYVEPRAVYVAPAPAPAVLPPPPAVRRMRVEDPVLVKIGELHSRDNDVREDAAQWLGEAKDPRAVRPLIDVLKHDPDHDVREEAARSLGYIGSLDAEHALQVAAESDPESDVRRAASKAATRVARELGRRNLR